MINLANKHPRVNILSPGAGVGGHCIAIDPWFIVSQFPKKSKMIETSRRTNKQKPIWALNKILEMINPTDTVACMGLSYKQDIDDIRESPSIEIANNLIRILGKDRVVVCEPHLNSLDGFELATIEQAVQNADFLVFCVPHAKFRRITPDSIENKKTLDLCGVLK